MNGLQTQQFLGIEGGAKINIQMPECGILPFSVPFVATSIRARHLGRLRNFGPTMRVHSTVHTHATKHTEEKAWHGRGV